MAGRTLIVRPNGSGGRVLAAANHKTKKEEK